MKTPNHSFSLHRRWLRRPLRALGRFGCAAFAGWALWVSLLGAWAQDSQVILHPGTITGEIRIMDPNNPTVPLPISYGSVTASCSTPSGASYSASASIINNRYTLVVEAGPWPYKITVDAHITKPQYYSQYYYWHWVFNSVVVAEGETVVQDFQTEAFVDIRVNVVGETV